MEYIGKFNTTNTAHTHKTSRAWFMWIQNTVSYTYVCNRPRSNVFKHAQLLAASSIFDLYLLIKICLPYTVYILVTAQRYYCISRMYVCCCSYYCILYTIYVVMIFLFHIAALTLESPYKIFHMHTHTANTHTNTRIWRKKKTANRTIKATILQIYTINRAARAKLCSVC